VDKITVIYAKFLFDDACKKLSKSANVSRSYSKNKSGFLFFGTRCTFIHAFFRQIKIKTLKTSLKRQNAHFFSKKSTYVRFKGSKVQKVTYNDVF